MLGRGDPGRQYNGGAENGGRGRGGRGGGGRGNNAITHMGQVPEIMGLLSGPEMRDSNILSIIRPSEPRTSVHTTIASRADLVSSLTSGSNVVALPRHAEWRMTPTIGKIIPGDGMKANHFHINTSSIPEFLTMYDVHIYRICRDGVASERDIATDEDTRTTHSVMCELRRMHPEWSQLTVPNTRPLGWAYDGRHLLFSNAELPLPDVNDRGQAQLRETVPLRPEVPVNGTAGGAVKQFCVVLTKARSFEMPSNYATATFDELMALSTSLLDFARVQQIVATPEWHLVGHKVFHKNAESIDLSYVYKALKGFSMQLNPTMAGLTLTVDMNVSCFLASGSMEELMWRALQGHYRTFQELYEACKSKKTPGLPPNKIATLKSVVSSCKVKVMHLGHNRKVCDIGPPSNSPASKFHSAEYGGELTVEKYFEWMSNKDGRYRKVKYPFLPTLNVGTKKRPILLPAEFLGVPGGQNRQRAMDATMCAKLVKHAAVRPDERFGYILRNDDMKNAVSVARSGEQAEAFGISSIASEPMTLRATLLPPAKLQFGGGQIVEPKLAGDWDRLVNADTKCVLPPPQPDSAGLYTYGILMVSNRRPNDCQASIVTKFAKELEKNSRSAGAGLKQGGPHQGCSANIDSLSDAFDLFKSGGARFVLVAMLDDGHYGVIKLVADRLGLMTSCIKYRTIEKGSQGVFSNVVKKVIAKLNGVSCTLASRAPPNPSAAAIAAGNRCLPPAPETSHLWIFRNKRVMLVGMDVSHPPAGSEVPSMAAVVASYDEHAIRYHCHISSQPSRQEMVGHLTDKMVSLLTSYRALNNNRMPEVILLYRDGVSEGQFNMVVEEEVPLIKAAVEHYVPADEVKIAAVICTKRHNTRIVYLDRTTKQYLNPCPGICVDASGGAHSIVSGKYLEFFCNSHLAVQGTAKPCKYTLVYDEVNFKLAELAMFTYWNTHLYARCNKSVSYATPAYYAHLAAKRAKELCAAGADPSDLIAISDEWASSGPSNIIRSPMYFV